jgi:molybdopterin-guanine dinucleotide biosynthesis protein A
MIIIGAASRNVGKTGFACALIRRESAATPVVGVKITAVREAESACPRGEKGCGLCNSFPGQYAVTEETERGEHKDTHRMLGAGASRVFWLRVRRSGLADGIAELLRRLPPGLPVVCESNAARQVIEPDLFLMIKSAGAASVKPSSQAVAALADRLVTFDGNGWDLPPEDVAFIQGRWRLRQPATAIILAGGRSRRMGQDKSLMPLHGEPMILRLANRLRPLFGELLIGANDPAKHRFLGADVVPDLEPDQGPLMGIASCLARARHEFGFVVSCDIPEIDADLIIEMLKAAEGHDIVIPEWPDGKVEPLFAVYRKSVVAPALALLGSGKRRIADLFDCVKTRRVEMRDTGWYRNLNTIEDYRFVTSVTSCG